MERDPADISADPMLRPGYVYQQSLDEFFAENAPIFLRPDWRELSAALGTPLDEAHDSLIQEWALSLSPDTNITELIYLRGYTTKVSRDAQMDQMIQVVRGMATKVLKDRKISEN